MTLLGGNALDVDDQVPVQFFAMNPSSHGDMARNFNGFLFDLMELSR